MTSEPEPSGATGAMNVDTNDATSEQLLKEVVNKALECGEIEDTYNIEPCRWIDDSVPSAVVTDPHLTLSQIYALLDYWRAKTIAAVDDVVEQAKWSARQAALTNRATDDGGSHA